MIFIGDKLKRLRKARNWKQEDVARLTGIKAGHVSDIERGKRDPRPETVKKLCEGLGVPDRYFYIDDSRLPADVLPDMPQDVADFILSGKYTSWLELTENAVKKGITLEQMQKIVEALSIK